MPIEAKAGAEWNPCTYNSILRFVDAINLCIAGRRDSCRPDCAATGRAMLYLVAHVDVPVDSAALGAVKEFVMAYKVHPILVNFTAALVPVSLASDILARLLGRDTLRDTA